MTGGPGPEPGGGPAAGWNGGSGDVPAAGSKDGSGDVPAPGSNDGSDRGSGGPTGGSAAVRRRGWFEVRRRQLRSAPPPVVRAVWSSVVVAAVLGILLLAYDLALDGGADLPGGDLRLLAGFLFVGAVAFLGAWLTYLAVPQPGRPGVRSGWSAALGLFAALPIAYLALVVLFQVVKPLLGGIDR